MGIYGEFSRPVELDQDLTNINEGNIIKDVTNLADLFKQWREASKKFAEKKWVYRFIKDDKQKEMLQKHYERLCADDISYGDYKKEFRFFCSFFGLQPNDIVIENIIFQPAKNNQPERIAIRYGQGRYKVKIPDDIFLIHTSPADNITALNPTFKSKTKGQYFYSSKRVFFTVLKPVNKFRAGQTKNRLGLGGDKTYKYITKNHIDYAYIDPTYIHFNDNCVFVETDQPIPVVQADKKIQEIQDKNNEVEEKEDQKEVKESFNISELESLQETSLKEFIQMIKDWKTQNKDHSIQVFKTDLTEEEKPQVQEWIDGMKNTENYSEYKKNFNAFCKFCHIVPDGTIITKYEVKGDQLTVEYSYNTKKIKLPEDLALYHMSKVEGIKKLIPQFKGKAERGYLYDKPRIYFTINKYMPKFLADYKPTEKMHKYRCKDNIQDVYVDPLVWNQVQGAVYVNTNKEIPVEEITASKDNKTEDEIKQESYAEYMAECGLEIIKE